MFIFIIFNRYFLLDGLYGYNLHCLSIVYSDIREAGGGGRGVSLGPERRGTLVHKVVFLTEHVAKTDRQTHSQVRQVWVARDQTLKDLSSEL